MTILSVVQKFCRLKGLPFPSTIFGGTDSQVLQIMQIAEEEGKDLRTRGDFNGIIFEKTFTTVAAEIQGDINTIAPGFRHFIKDTLWDRTAQIPLFSMNAQEWQYSKAITTTGPRYTLRVRGNKLLSNPAPTAGLTWAFEYLSNNWILAVDGTTYKESFTADTDTILLPESLIEYGLKWRWLEAKGLPYDEAFKTYEMQVLNYLGRDGIKRDVQMVARRDMSVNDRLIVQDRGWFT